MKTFSKRFLTMLLAAAMVFSLSGMTVFAAETDDSAAQEYGTATIAAANVYDANYDWYINGSSPYTISSAEDLAGLSDIVNGTAAGINQYSFDGDIIYLTTDIIMNSDSDVAWHTSYTGEEGASAVTFNEELGDDVKAFTPIGNMRFNSDGTVASGYSFEGTFDGKGYSIENLYVTGDDGYLGLFGVVGSAEGKEGVGVVGDFNISGLIECTGGRANYEEEYVGSVCAKLNAGGTIQNVVNEALVDAPYTDNVGGIVGFAGTPADMGYTSNPSGYNTFVLCCGNEAPVRGYVGLGGIAGRNAATVEYCYNSGWILERIYNQKGTMGGIVGGNSNEGIAVEESVVAYCYNTGMITNNGYNDAYDAQANGYAGICGVNYGGHGKNEIYNCYNRGPIPTGLRNHFSIVSALDEADAYGYGAFVAVRNNYSLISESIHDSEEDVVQRTGIRVSDDDFKKDTYGDNDILTCLGPCFIADENDENEGYPILWWQDEEAKVPELTKLTIATPPEKTEYEAGEIFDPTGMVVIAEYGEEVRALVTPFGGTYHDIWYELTSGYTYSRDGLKAGADSITLSYTDGDITKTVDVPITVSGSEEPEEEPPTQNANGQYELATVENLEWFANQVNNKQQTDIDAIMVEDIDASESESFAPIGSSASLAFKGTFDGNGHTVKLNLSNADTYTGLFGYLDGGSVSNVTVDGSVSGTQYVGGVAGYITDGGSITNCVNLADVSASTTHAAGIAGYITGGSSITDCVNRGNVTSAGNYAAGIVGVAQNSSDILEGCLNYGTISGAQYVGGMAGTFQSGTLTRCGNEGTITGTGAYVGGIAGYVTSSCSTFYSNYNKGAVQGSYNVGGLVGYNQANLIDSCYNTGAVTATTDSSTVQQAAGGIVGVSYGSGHTYSNIFNTGIVSAVHAGALVGCNSGSSVTFTISNGYYLEGSAEQPYLEVGSGRVTTENVASETASEIGRVAFLKLLTINEGYFKKGCTYPILPWETADHQFADGYCTVCGEIEYLSIVMHGETSQISSDTIDTAMADAPTTTFTYTSRGNTNENPAQYILISDLIGIDEDFCSYTVTSDDGPYYGLPTNTYLYWRDNTNEDYYRTAVDGGEGNQWRDKPEIIEVVSEHMWSVQWEWSDDYNSAEAIGTCSVCGIEEDVDATVTSVTQEPTATEDGATVYTATAKFSDGQVETDSKTVTIPATGEPPVTYNDIPVYKDGNVIYTISGDDFATAQAEASPQMFTYSSSGTTKEVTAQFVLITDLLDGDMPDDGCGFIATASDSFTTTFTEDYLDTAYLFYDEDEGYYRTAVNGSAGNKWAKDVVSLTLGHIFENGVCTICGAKEAGETHSWEVEWTWTGLPVYVDCGVDGYEPLSLIQPWNVAESPSIKTLAGDTIDATATAVGKCTQCGETETVEGVLTAEYLTAEPTEYVGALAEITATATFSDEQTATDEKRVLAPATGDLEVNYVTSSGTTNASVAFSDINTMINKVMPFTLTYTSSSPQPTTMPFVKITDILEEYATSVVEDDSFCCFYPYAPDGQGQPLTYNAYIYQRDQADTYYYRTAESGSYGESWWSNLQRIDVMYMHQWGTPTWTWADDYSSATVTVACTRRTGRGRDVCTHTDENVEAVVTISEEDGYTVYTATATLCDGQVITAEQKVENEEGPTVSDVTITSGLTDNEKTYDGTGFTLSASATVEPSDAQVSYQWYKDGAAIEGATEATLDVDGNVSDSGTYTCEMSATSDGLTGTGSGEITVTITKAAQEISYAKTTVTKTDGEEAFTNELTETTVFGEITYTSSDETVATVDENGEVTILGTGETTITATAAGTENYEEASATYTLIVSETDKELLEAAIEAADSLDENDYTPESWEAFEKVLANAQAVLHDPDASEEDVKQATLDVMEAVADLVRSEPAGETVDKSDLLDEYAEAMQKNESDYTPESWEPFAKALAEAQEVLLDPSATEEDVEAAEEALKTATDNLEPTGTPKNGLCQIEKGVRWGYYVDDVVDTDYTGFVRNDNGDWYVQNGYVIFADASANGVFKDKTGAIGEKGTWYYVVRGKAQQDFTGLANYKNENGWWYIVDGKVDFSHNGVDKNKNGWYYVTGGKVQFGFTGLANYKNDNGWWYISGGKVNFNANTVAKNKNGWWYVTGGKVQFGFTGLANYKNANGWWYIKSGKVDFTASGVYKNVNGWWYVKGGKVQFNYTGTVASGGRTYNVIGGRVN